MDRLGRIAFLLTALGSLFIGTSHAEAPFELTAQPKYASVDVATTLYAFNAVLRSPTGGTDHLYVEFEPHLPESWFAQYCQTSTGICYFSSTSINIPGGNVPDTLRVDFFLPAGDAEMGWVDFHIYRIGDEGSYREVTFALGHGVTLPLPSFTFTCANPFRFANPNDVVEIHGVMKSNDTIQDQIIVTPREILPGDWFAQYCQTSTGICYFGPATIPFPAGVRDTLRVDFFTGNVSAVGHYRLKLQSAANPAIYKTIDFGAMTGSVPSDAGDIITSARFGVRAEPNPLRTHTDFRISVVEPSTVHLMVVDASGRRVLSLDRTVDAPGVIHMGWNGCDEAGTVLPRGTYFYRAQSGTSTAEGKLIITR
jgi:hypothetical protein